jgi:tetratricopeptide (TPR) repeat protein
MHSPAVRWAIRIAALIVAALALNRYTLRPWQANRVLWTVQQRSQMALQSGPDRAARIARYNIDQLETIAPACATNVDYYILLAANARIMGDNPLAIHEYTAALSADHRPEIYFNRGMTYLESGNVEAAVPDFVRAARFSPTIVESLDGELRKRVTREAGLE